jgi:deoxyribonuclease V
VKPVYVSPGHLVDLPTSIALVLKATGRFRVPEPLRLAHQATTAAMRRLDVRARAPRSRDYPDFVAE